MFGGTSSGTAGENAWLRSVLGKASGVGGTSGDC